MTLPRSLVLQGVQFDGAYALSLHEGLDCLREITTPRGPVNQSLNAIADFYEQFYAFRYICIDPPASSQSQAVDHLLRLDPAGPGPFQKASLPENPGIDQWFLRSNSLFTRLRDAHVDWRNGGTKADTVLNQFIFILQNDATTSPVRMEVSARSAAAVDGFADPRCKKYDVNCVLDLLKVHSDRAPALDEASFPRRWLLDPALSPLGATYGYYQLQRDESGELFAVVKLTRFYLTEDESAGFQVQSQFTAFWRELVQTSKDHSVSRLLVDLSGNPGGFVDFAYLFVRALHPLLQFAEVCNEYDRPVGSLFHAWKHVNVTPLVNFLKTVAPAEKRVEELSEEKKEHLTQILHAVTKACIAMDVLSYDDYMMIQSAIDTLDMGEMDAYTLQETVQVLSDSAASFGNPFTLFLMHN
ncbi:unnamed protein product [Durusdinium trenchii]|uniref:Tail specific protease domain-containing protein n=1 Tax=Durusdinium trenchii TaxID=1381693 RepID=A0ABP0S8U3_9DINO